MQAGLITRIRVGFVVLVLASSFPVGRGWNEYQTAVGDPGMKRDGLRVAIEAWSQCNEVHQEAPHMGSPRHADCFDLVNDDNTNTSSSNFFLPFFLFVTSTMHYTSLVVMYLASYYNYVSSWIPPPQLAFFFPLLLLSRDFLERLSFLDNFHCGPI